MKAKEVSLAAQIIMFIWIGWWSTFKFIFRNEISMYDVIISGIGIGASFSPVYLSIWMEKIKEIRFGDK